MVKNILLIILILLTTNIQAGVFLYGSGEATNLENNIGYDKHGQKIITGDSDDPTSVAKSGDAGSLYLGTSGVPYIKKDAGSSTNWNEFLLKDLIEELNFDTSYSTTCSEGKTYWNSTDKTLNVCTDQTGVSLQVGQEIHKRVYNETGSTITNGQVVYIDSFNVAQSLSTVALAQADSATTSRVTLGIATHDIADTSIGIITTAGLVRDINTSGYTAGDILWLSDSTPGALTNVKPSSPNFSIKIGTVDEVNATTGSITVAVAIGDNTDDVIKVFNGAILEDHTFDVSSDGSTVTASLEQAGGGDLSLFFNGVFSVFNSTPAATVTLTPGSDTSPTQNFVYIPESTMTLTANTTGFPSAQHVPVGTVIVQSAASAATDGLYKVHAWTDHLSSVDGQGHVSHVNRWIREQHATYLTGVTPTINGTGTNTVTVNTTSGTILQLHEHTFPSFTGGTMYVVNDSVTPYIKRTNLALATLDSTGATLQNRTFAMVLWGVISQDAADSKLFINLPGCSYGAGKPDEVRADLDGCTNTTIPKEYKGTGFLISRIVMSINPGGTVWTIYTGDDDLRGSLPGIVGGSGSTAVTDFPDNQFTVYNVTDDTKIMDFDLSGLTTATTRTMSVPDIDGTLVVEDASNNATATNYVSDTLVLRNDADTFSTTVKALDALLASWTLTLPPNDGDADQVLTTNGSGVTTWETPAVSPLLDIVTRTSALTLTASNDVIIANATSGAFTLTLPTAVGNEGKVFYFHILTTNSNLVTLDANGTQTIDGSLTIPLSGTTASYSIVSDNANWKSLSSNRTKTVFLSDVKADATPGGGNTASTWVKRDLNTIDGDSEIVSLSSSVITLQAGEYKFEAYAPAAGVNRNQIRLQNTTDASTACVGSSVYAVATATGQSMSILKCRVTITSAKAFEIQHITETANASIGFGVNVNAAVGEVYTQVEITKLK